MSKEPNGNAPIERSVIPHTPGPWRVAERCNCMIDVLHDNNANGAITKALCRVQARDSWILEAEANARLIAAAPDLLEALRDMVSDRECLSQATIDFARNAISKATGN